MLQVWRSKHDRDHPDTIKRRFVSAAFMTLVSPLFVWQCGAANLLDTFSISELLGLRTAGGSASSLRFCLILTVVSCLRTSVVVRSCTGLPATSTADHDSVPGTHGNAAARCRLLHTVHCTQFVKISFNTLKLQKQFNFQLTLSHFNKSKSGHD